MRLSQLTPPRAFAAVSHQRFERQCRFSFPSFAFTIHSGPLPQSGSNVARVLVWVTPATFLWFFYKIMLIWLPGRVQEKPDASSVILDRATCRSKEPAAA